MPAAKTQPKYRQIADFLRRGILDGTYAAGQPLPSEEVLARQFGVTRPTVRQGLTELRASGLVEVMTGRGTFARSPHGRPALTRPRGVRRTPDGGYAEADGIAWTDAAEPVAGRVDAPLDLAELLRIPPGDPVHTREALQTAAPGLRQLHRTYVPFSALKGTPYEDRVPPPAPGLYAVLAASGHRLRFTECVRPRMPLPDQAAALRVPEGVPVLVVRRLTLGAHERPLAVEEFHLPGDDLELSYTL